MEETRRPERGSRAFQRFVLLLIILQSIGIRAFPLQGMISGVLVCVLLLSRTELSVRALVWFLAAAGVFIGLASRTMPGTSALIYLTLVISAAFLFSTFVRGRWAEVEIDVLQIAWWLSLYGLIGFFVHVVVGNSASPIDLGGMRYYMAGPFFVSHEGRATGLCWEPGLLQYLANVSLFLGIKHRWAGWKLAISLATVVVTFSTAGVFALAPTLVYVLFAHRRTTRQWFLIGTAALMVLALSLTVFLPNIEEKLGGENTSGLIRLRDLQVGWDLLTAKPLFGHGQIHEKYLLEQSALYAVVDELFSSEFIDDVGDLGGGYTNGLMGLLACNGLIVGALLLWGLLQTQLIQGAFKERLVFFLICVITFSSEPITNTSWFFTIAIGGIAFTTRPRQLVEI